MKNNDAIMDKEILPGPIDKELYYYDQFWRVKVFELNPDSTWSDCGTGNATIIHQVFSLILPKTE